MTTSGQIVSGGQIRAGRALLGWRQSDLAKAAGLHPKAVQYWEGKPTIKGREVGVERICDTFEHAGVALFTDPSPGVRLVARR